MGCGLRWVQGSMHLDGMHWRHLANTIQSAMCRGDATFLSNYLDHLLKPGMQHVQALTDISHSALCCHSNETRAPIANPRKSAQLDSTLYNFLKLHPGPCSSVGMRRERDRHSDRHTDIREGPYTFHLSYVSREM